MRKYFSIRLCSLKNIHHSLFFLLMGLGLLFSSSVFADASIEQGSIVMQRFGYCDAGEKSYETSFSPPSISKPCRIDFTDKNAGSLSFQNNRGGLKLDSFSVVGSNHPPLKSLYSEAVTIYTSGFNSETLPSAQYSLSENGNMNSLIYTDEYLSGFNQATLPEGYYAIKDSTGLFWAAYLNYQEEGDYATWDAVDHPQHPWQICSAKSSFSRDKGCDGAHTSITENSVFDGAGSLVNPTVDCYGCNKDEAKMHPHQGNSSTVVFQWLYDQVDCNVLEIYAQPAMDVTLRAKSWNDIDMQQAFQVSLTNHTPFYLDAVNTWTTFSVTSDNPINTSVSISAFCAQSKSTSVASQAVSPSVVKVDSNANWMGTGSLISHYNRDDYGINKDLSIGSNTNNALTSFQWLASENCTAIKVGDGSNINTPRNALVSIKTWDAEFFSPHCNSLPCALENASPTSYYILKIESGAGEVPNGIQARCQ